MVAKVNELVRLSFELINYVDPDEEISTPVFNRAYQRLAILLKEYRAQTGLLGFNKSLSFTLTPNKEQYEISELVTADVNAKPVREIVAINITYTEGGTHYKLKPKTDKEYNDLITYRYQGIPSSYNLRFAIDASFLLLYPLPSEAYVCNLRVKQDFADIDGLSRIDEFPAAYQNFLQYALAKQLAFAYKPKSWTALLEDEYQTLKSTIVAYTSPIISPERSSMMTSEKTGDAPIAGFQ